MIWGERDRVKEGVKLGTDLVRLENTQKRANYG